PHPNLHSFPTRRSSDLQVKRTIRKRQTQRVRLKKRDGRRTVRFRNRLCSRPHQHAVRKIRADYPRLGLAPQGKRQVTGPAAKIRSEEHTSELQSRENLV